MALHVHPSSQDSYSSTQYPPSAIAVVGVSCKFAGADSLEQLWQVLETGASQCRELPKNRFPDFRFERRPFKRPFQANVMEDVDSFDHRFFNVSSREASFRDPQQRLALEVTYQALESAGHFARRVVEEQRDVGCYFAATMNEYHENVVTHAPSAFSLTGSIRPFIAGQVSHYFGFTGPAVTLDAACAASGVAVNIACRAVASGECKSAIAGAANLFISPDTFQDLAAGHFTSPTGPSKPFDAAADGYGRGEGVAVVVLKRLSDALMDGDVVKGVILATAANQCANESPITVPHAPSQSSLILKALQISRLNAEQIGYVEAHGTGTRVGDPIEAESIRTVFGNQNHDPAVKTYIGSLKSNIGHTEATAALSGLLKVILMIEKGIIPQQALFSRLNPDIYALEPYGLDIPKKNIQWTAEPKIGCVNNYGASGCNTTMIVTGPPKHAIIESCQRASKFPVSINAFSKTSLESYRSALLGFLDRCDQSDITALDAAFHLSRRRNPELPFSVSTVISTLDELKDFLNRDVSQTIQNSKFRECPTVLFFGGQDGKPACVSHELYDSCAVFRKHLNCCDSILQALSNYSLYPTIFEPNASDAPILAHAKLFSVQYASAKAWLDCGLKPSRIVGHSFGQITGLCVSGTLTLHDALDLVVGRARLIDKLWGPDTGSMIAIEATQEELSGLLEQYSDLGLETACFNGVRSFVLAGKTSSVDSMEASLQASSQAYRFKRLHVSNAFHSALAEPLVEPLQHIVEGLDLQEPNIPLETCSELSTKSSTDPATIASHIRQPVYFHQAVKRIADHLGPSMWIEAGSGNNASLLRRALEPQASGHEVKSIKIGSSSALMDLAQTTADLWDSHLKIRFWHFHQDQQHQYEMLNLPPYQFDKTRHWLEWEELGGQSIATVPVLPGPVSMVHLVKTTKQGSSFEINTQVERWRDICAQNRVLGVPTCPISLLLAILSEAIGMARGNPAQHPSVYRVQHLKWTALTATKTEDKLSLEISQMDSQQFLTFRMSGISTPHHDIVSGTVWADKASTQSDFVRYERLIDTVRIRQLKEDAQSDCIRGRGVYKILAELFQVPKHNEVIHEVSTKGSEAIASLTSFSESLPLALENLIQVPLLCLNGMYERPDTYFFINSAIGDAYIQTPSSPLANTKTSHLVYLKFFELGGPNPSCDMYVFDTTSGRMSAIILDLAFAQVSIDSFRQDLGSREMMGRQQTSDCKAEQLDVPAPEGMFFAAEQSSAPHTFSKESMQQNSLPDLTQSVFELLARIADVDADKLCESSVIADLGIDSLMWIEVADEINKVFEVDIDLLEFSIAEDIKTLCNLIAKQATGFSHRLSVSSGSPLHSTTCSDTTASSSCTRMTKDCEVLEPASIFPASEGAEVCILEAAFKAFDSIRFLFDDLAKEAGCGKFWTEVYPSQIRLIEAYIIEAFATLGCDLKLMKAGDRVSIVTRGTGRTKLLERLLFVLRDSGLITQKSSSGWLRTDKVVPVQLASAELFDEIQVQFPKWAPEHELLHIAGSNLAGNLDGTQNPLKVLFGSPESRKLMADQYLIAPLQRTVSRQLASFIERCFRGQKLCKPLRVLEIGGGTCGTTVYALDAFVRACIPVEYTFTDISPWFLTAAKSKLKDYDFVKYDTLDISITPSVQFRGQYDMIIGTNVVHATPNAKISADHVRQMLRVGGIFAMVEYTRIYAAMDVVYGQLDGWWLFDDGRTHAIMNEEEWDATLKSAGYSRVEWTGSETAESAISRIFLAS